MAQIRTYYRNIEEEKNTYSAFIPEDQGVWALGSDEESGKNFAKLGTLEIVKGYLEKGEFSVKSMSKIMERGYREVSKEKIKMNRDFDSEISLLTVVLKERKIICGNIGETSLKMYRDGNCVEEINGEEVKMTDVEEGDFIVLGNNKFWEVIEENEKIKGYNFGKELKYNSFFMQNLKDMVEYSEKRDKTEISFFVLYVEELEEEIREKGKKPSKKYMYFFMCLVFFLAGVSFGKLGDMQSKRYEISEARESVMERGIGTKGVNRKDRENEVKEILERMEKVGKEENKEKKELRENVSGNMASDGTDMAVENMEIVEVERNKENEKGRVVKATLSKDRIERELRGKIEKNLENASGKNGNNKNKVEKIKKERDKVLGLGGKNKNVSRQNVKTEKKEIGNRVADLSLNGKNENEKGVKIEVKEDKNIGKNKNREKDRKIESESRESVKARKSKNKKKILTLDEEIKLNWELLGRDQNGNVLT